MGCHQGYKLEKDRGFDCRFQFDEVLSLSLYLSLSLLLSLSHTHSHSLSLFSPPPSFLPLLYRILYFASEFVWCSISVFTQESYKKKVFSLSSLVQTERVSEHLSAFLYFSLSLLLSSSLHFSLYHFFSFYDFNALEHLFSHTHTLTYSLTHPLTHHTHTHTHIHTHIAPSLTLGSSTTAQPAVRWR